MHTNFVPLVRKDGMIEGGGFAIGFSLKCSGPSSWFSFNKTCNPLAELGMNLTQQYHW